MAKGKAHSDETKQAVMAALLAGQGVGEIADRYRLPESSVRNWKKEIPPEKLAEVSAKKEASHAGRIEGLLFDYLAANLLALKVQSELAAEDGYLRRYPPQQLAVLHGVMADKGVRFLEALSAGGEGTRPEDHEPEPADPEA